MASPAHQKAEAKHRGKANRCVRDADHQ
ncbi:hypothetical protein MexAM1_META1p4007 [Methylorubrum extorquens AM1]|uniref:Uncharacterized protein n=1 Tax=Methylorubrum extorquens (strain ATCC 14718 / DSM 1338 / JCM 2805 / NCIMB 9133 / AM1) TaxID=272630 RepID=C5B184_METEA|nr:hypothetical protein MexAM1_META1p4007 [Methylorubrum extorquens AM1]